MAYPQPYTTASPILASYSYTDIVNGLVYSIFYAVKHKEASAEKSFLSPVLLEAGEVFSATTTTDSSGFNLPRTLKGDAYISAVGIDVNNWTFKLQHYDGTTATDISSTITGPTNNADGNRFTVVLPLTETHFSAGDQLRLISTKTDGSLDSSATNPFKIYIPSRIDE